MMAKEKSVLPSCEENMGDRMMQLIHWLSYALLAAAVASIVLVFEVRKSPSPWGWCLILIGLVSIVSAISARLLAFNETKQLFVQTVILLASLAGQAASFLMLFCKPGLIIQHLKPMRNDHDTRILMKVGASLNVCMFFIQLAVLILACATYNCDVLAYQYEDLEARTWRKRRKMTRVLEEATARTSCKERESADDLSRKMAEKYGKWVAEGQFEVKK